ncbi:MAG: hypothetical protein WC748_06370 [Legionellales bacterium]|jgi:precorrin-6B methylase 2
MINFNWLAQYKKRRQAMAVCHKLYYNVPGFNLAKQGRADQQLFSYEYIYGEINYKSFIKLLDQCEINKESIFYDLGSGVGKAVVCAALLYDFKKTCGIEQLELLHNSAISIQQSELLKNKTIHFIQADLLTSDWSEANIIFINASAFIADFWQNILEKLKQLKPGTQIIIISKLLPSDHFAMHYSDFLPMSCGIVRVGIYVRH